ncbi:unnamed protein product, partial [Mesorhabditis belari]|uniref:Conserved oligomeric Golgi complex subunit 6 n=1 Tax=Mesorhabditis belari TaxID=2138241 RepID=A0AAF3EC54_9BILA
MADTLPTTLPSANRPLGDPLKDKVEAIINQCKRVDFKSEEFQKGAELYQEALDVCRQLPSSTTPFHPITTPILYERAMDDAMLAKFGSKLEYLNKLNGKVQEVHSKAKQMRGLCEELTKTISENKEKTEHFLAQTNAIRSKMSLLEAKAALVDEFLDKFTLSEKEEKALLGDQNDGTVSMEFFDALNRIKQIYEDSKQLVRTSTEHVAALEVMEDMASRLEKAYEVLYRSIQRECRLLSSDFSDIKSVVIQSFSALQEREILFKYALDEFAMARKNHVLRIYIDALTRGGGTSGNKPIELLSHDPLRYVGDMLAWMYQAIENEKGILNALLKMCRPEVASSCSTDVISQVSSALCRPFKVRVEQSLAGGEADPVIIYKLNGLFGFYLAKFPPLTGSASELCQTMKDLQELAMSIFMTGLSSTVQRILGRMGPPDYDLLPVPAVHQLLSLLKEVLDTHNGAMSVENPKEQFNQVFSCILDPLLRSVQLAATQLASPLDVAVYTLNCLSAIQAVVLLYQFTDQRLEMLKALIEGNEDVLVSEESSAILSNTSLIGIYQKAAAHSSQQGPMSAIPGLDAVSITNAIASFSNFISQSDKLRLDLITRVNSTRIRESIMKRTIDNIAAAYAVIVRKIEDPSNGYGEILHKSPDEVMGLLK